MTGMHEDYDAFDWTLHYAIRIFFAVSIIGLVWVLVYMILNGA